MDRSSCGPGIKLLWEKVPKMGSFGSGFFEHPARVQSEGKKVNRLNQRRTTYRKGSK